MKSLTAVATLASLNCYDLPDGCSVRAINERRGVRVYLGIVVRCLTHAPSVTGSRSLGVANFRFDVLAACTAFSELREHASLHPRGLG